MSSLPPWSFRWALCWEKWSGRGDFNSRPPVHEGNCRMFCVMVPGFRSNVPAFGPKLDPSVGGVSRCHKNFGRGSVKDAQLVIQFIDCDLIVVFRTGFIDLCLSLVQLRLAQFHNRTKTEIVPRLRQIQCHSGLL